jgi:hypothetical protein
MPIRSSVRTPIPCCSLRVSPQSVRVGRLGVAVLALVALALGSGCDDEDESTLRGPINIGGGGGAGASEAGAAGADASTPPDGVDAGIITADALERDVLATSVLGILTRDCGPCHAGSERAGGVGAIDDVDSLVSSGLIVPGNAAQSPLFDSIRSGRMPPAGMLSRPSVGEQWLLEGFIDSLSVDAEECELPPFPSVDETYAAMLADVTTQPEADRPFIRYVSLTDSAGEACGERLQERRYALFEAVNGASLDSEIHVPVPIDAAELIYRLDIRDYDWDRPLDLDADGSDDHPDGWLALVAAAGPYAVELQGPEADALRAATSAAVPVLPSSVLVWAASSGDVYYALIGARANIYDTQLALGIEYAASFDQGLVRRAGFWRSVDRTEIIVERHPQPAPGRAYWSFEPQLECDAESIYDYPDGNDRVVGQTIWHLPNGLLAYSIEDLGGTRLTGAPAPCAQCCVDLTTIYPVGGNPAGCHACHHRGFAPVRDEVLAVVQENVRYYSPATVEAFVEIYSASDLDARMAADNAVYLDALARTGVSPSLRSPLSRVFLSFERAPLDIRRAAAELGATAAALRENLARLPSGFASLAESGASISRAVMTEGQRAARCELSERARNRPIDCPSGS